MLKFSQSRQGARDVHRGLMTSSTLHHHHPLCEVITYYLTLWPLVHTAYPTTFTPLDVPVGDRMGGFQWTCRTPGVCPHSTCTSWGGSGGPAIKYTENINITKKQIYLTGEQPCSGGNLKTGGYYQLICATFCFKSTSEMFSLIKAWICFESVLDTDTLHAERWGPQPSCSLTWISG